MDKPVSRPRAGFTADVSIRAYLESDFDVLVERWHETNLVSYRYVAEQQRHTLADAQRFFRSHIVPVCELWIAMRSNQLAGVIALNPPRIRTLSVFHYYPPPRV